MKLAKLGEATGAINAFNRTIKELKRSYDDFLTKYKSTFNRTIKELKRLSATFAKLGEALLIVPSRN